MFKRLISKNNEDKPFVLTSCGKLPFYLVILVNFLNYFKHIIENKIILTNVNSIVVFGRHFLK